MVSKDVKPTIPEVVKDFSEYYRINPVWGSLHIVLADGNVQDEHVRFCLESARTKDDISGMRLAEILSKMSKTQRLKLPIAVHEYDDRKEKEALKWFPRP